MNAKIGVISTRDFSLSCFDPIDRTLKGRAKVLRMNADNAVRDEGAGESGK